jgi:superoxide dismutase
MRLTKIKCGNIIQAISHQKDYRPSWLLQKAPPGGEKNIKYGFLSPAQVQFHWSIQEKFAEWYQKLISHELNSVSLNDRVRKAFLEQDRQRYFLASHLFNKQLYWRMLTRNPPRSPDPQLPEDESGGNEIRNSEKANVTSHDDLNLNSLVKQIESSWGSLLGFKEEFIERSKKTKNEFLFLTLIGETELVIDDDPDLIGKNQAKTLIALDLSESAYYFDYGRDQRDKYVKHYLNLLDWKVLDDTFCEERDHFIQYNQGRVAHDEIG